MTSSGKMKKISYWITLRRNDVNVMDLLACMSLAGTIPVVLCFLLYLLQGGSYNYQLGRKLLLTGVVFFLIPFQLVKYLIPEDIFPKPMFSEESQLYLSHSLNFWHEKPNEYVWMPQWLSVLIFLWAMVVIGFSVYEFIAYRKAIRRISGSIVFEIEDTEKNFTYYIVPDKVSGPCTIGFFHQKIIIPRHLPHDPDFEKVYKHEYAHLKNHDNFVKLLCLAVMCLHWMNPAAYLLLYLYRQTAEAVSDGAATEGCTEEEIKSYAILLVTESTSRKNISAVWKNNLSGHKENGKTMKIMLRRIDFMMQKKRNGKLQKGIMVAVSALTVLASASTALAYQPMQSSDMSVGDSINNYDLDFMNFNSTADIVAKAADIDFSKSDDVFVDLDGNQVSIMSLDNSRALCTHSMVDGYLNNHSSNSSGGCTVYVYTCQRCKKCGYLANAKYYATTTYAKCPHK